MAVDQITPKCHGLKRRINVSPSSVGDLGSAGQFLLGCGSHAGEELGVSWAGPIGCGFLVCIVWRLDGGPRGPWSSRRVWAACLAAPGFQERKRAVVLKAGPGTSTASCPLHFMGQRSCRPAATFSWGSKPLRAASFGTSYQLLSKGDMHVIGDSENMSTGHTCTSESLLFHLSPVCVCEFCVLKEVIYQHVDFSPAS